MKNIWKKYRNGSRIIKSAIKNKRKFGPTLDALNRVIRKMIKKVGKRKLWRR